MKRFFVASRAIKDANVSKKINEEKLKTLFIYNWLKLRRKCKKKFALKNLDLKNMQKKIIFFSNLKLKNMQKAFIKKSSNAMQSLFTTSIRCFAL